ncbi:MAG: crosslink repair DNA glycosylase YcaQ family protein [Chloroflexota bacterium]
MADRSTRFVDAATARRFLVTRQLLAPPRALPPGPESVLELVRRLGSVQFDPLSVAGRNHDLVLHARIRDYDPAWTDALLYERRELFEIWNKGLSLVPTAELPWYRVFWTKQHAGHAAETGAFTRYAATVEHVLARIRAEGPLSTADFDAGPKVDWYWGPTSETRAVFEALADGGVLGLARREGNRRYLDLVERLFPPELLAQHPDEREQRRHKLLSRYRAHGLLGAGGQAEIFLGTARYAKRRPQDPPETIVRDELRAELEADGEIWPVEVEGVRGLRHVLGEELDLLDEIGAAGELTAPPAVTFVAPLDPFAWDRDLLRSLFGFDYLWEVYVPEPKRRWGYYVLPILFGDRLVGRIEPRIDRMTREVRVLAAWWEDGFDIGRAEGFVPAMRDALADYLRFGGARTVAWAPALARERRLIGVRPVGSEAFEARRPGG